MLFAACSVIQPSDLNAAEVSLIRYTDRLQAACKTGHDPQVQYYWGQQ